VKTRESGWPAKFIPLGSVNHKVRGPGASKCPDAERLYLKKVYEYCTECDVYIYMILQTKQDGQIFIVNSDSSGQFPPPPQVLVCQMPCFVYSY
jgi:hypothetical protein